MLNILDRIVEAKRDELVAARAVEPLDRLRARAQRTPAPRDFFAAIRVVPPHGIHLIAEIKKASPSAGLIRADFDPVAIARVYHRSGASCLSVLTDRAHFQGDLAHVAQVKAAVPLPVLRKDFIIDAYQVYESLAAGADAILLIAEVLAPDDLAAMLRLAESLELTTLIESHSPESLLGVKSVVQTVAPQRCLLGINNRDLAGQVVDLSTTARLAGLLDDRSVLVVESGIRTRDDVRFVQGTGAAAILVGEALMSAHDIEAKVTELLGS